MIGGIHSKFTAATSCLLPCTQAAHLEAIAPTPVKINDGGTLWRRPLARDRWNYVFYHRLKIRMLFMYIRMYLSI